MIERFMLKPSLPCVLLLAALTSQGCSDDASPAKDAASVGAALDAAPAGATTMDAPADAPSATASDSGAGDLSGDMTPAVSADVGSTDQGGTVPDAGVDSGATQEVGSVDAPAGDSSGDSPEVATATDVSTDAIMAACKRVCEITDMVTCPGVTGCLPDCLQSLQGKCVNAGYALELCLAERKPSDFVCETDPFPQITLRPGFCMPQLVAFGSCLTGP